MEDFKLKEIEKNLKVYVKKEKAITKFGDTEIKKTKISTT